MSGPIWFAVVGKSLEGEGKVCKIFFDWSRNKNVTIFGEPCRCGSKRAVLTLDTGEGQNELNHVAVSYAALQV